MSIALLLTCRNEAAVRQHYLPALRRGGWKGEVRILTPHQPLPPLEGMAGLLLTGGDDIHPRAWDPLEPLHPTAEPDEARDALEGPLLRAAWDLGLPILGICRGEQLLNVALGGSLIQDLPSHLGLDPGLHRRGTSQIPEKAHAVSVAPDSRLAGLVGTLAVEVNSRHHQAVLRVAPPLRAVAWHGPLSGEGLVEAVEARDPERWVLGVQWHPENLVDMEGPIGRSARGIFEGFAKALQA